MTTFIHVNRQNLRNNPRNKRGKRRPVFRVLDERYGVREGVHVDVHGPSVLVYRPDHRLRGSAVTAWIETEAEVDVY